MTHRPLASKSNERRTSYTVLQSSPYRLFDYACGKASKIKRPIMKIADAKSPVSLYELHKERFGVYPVITGINAFSPDKITECIINALETGVPYVEPDVPEGALI